MNPLAIGSNNQRDIVGLLLVGFFLLCCRAEVCEIPSKEVLGESYLVYKDEVGVVLEVVFHDVGEHPTSLYVLGGVFFDRKRFYVVEGIAHFGQMTRYDGTCILFSEFSADVF